MRRFIPLLAAVVLAGCADAPTAPSAANSPRALLTTGLPGLPPGLVAPTKQGEHRGADLEGVPRRQRSGPDDRRTMVIKTPSAREGSFYEEVAAELRAGGIAARVASTQKGMQ